MESNLLEDAESLLKTVPEIKSVTIEAKDGKEYKIEKSLPVKAGNLFNSLMVTYGNKDPVTGDEIEETSDRMLEGLAATIIAANKRKYPELTRNYILGYYDKDDNYIEGQFDEIDLSTIYNMYLSRWIEMTSRKLRTDVAKKKAAAQEAGEQ